MGMRIELDGGKYTAIFEDNGQMKALRHGEPWRDITGDNLIYFLMCEVEKLRDAEIDRLKAERAAALAATPAADAEVVAEKADPLDALRWGANVAETLLSIGRAIGFGRAQQILGEQWEAEHNCAPRGRMGVTVKDDAQSATPAAAPVVLPEHVMFAIDRFDAYFRSANGVPPNSRISVPTSEWQELRALLATGGQAQSDARDAEIDRLNGDLAAIGAGGVESLRKPSTERASYEFSSKNRDGTWTPWLPLGGGLKFENVKVRQQHASNAPQGCTAAERPDSPCVALCTTLYDEYCRGCGRHYLEVARWGQMNDVEKGEVWARLEGGSDKCTPSKS